jgi:nucleoid-associated protein YgaU
MKVPPAQTMTDGGATRAAETAPNSAPFAITVKPDQTLQDISEQYLEGFDRNRLHQIQALNPKLTDFDHIETGQKIWLPVPLREPVAPNAASFASVRKLP